MSPWVRASGARIALALGVAAASAPAPAADYAVSVTRVQQGWYRIVGQRMVVSTGACGEMAAGAAATLSVATGTGQGELRFGTGARCSVTGTYAGQSLAEGRYALTVSGGGEFFVTPNGWLVETLFDCLPAATLQAATLGLTEDAPQGDAYGQLQPAGGAACTLYWLYRAWGASAATPGPELRPDLVIDPFSVAPTATAGQPFQINLVLRNIGNDGAGASRTRTYFSRDAVKSADDVAVSFCQHLSLAAQGTQACSGTVSLPATLAAGSYQVIAVADDEQQVLESNGANNERVAANPVQVSATGGHLLSLQKSGPGSGELRSLDGLASCAASQMQCSATLARDSLVVLQATPQLGSLFNGWSGACSGLGECRLTMSAARSVGAHFASAASVQQVPWVTQAEGYLSRFALVNTSQRTLTYNFVLQGESGQALQLDAAQAQATLPPKTQRVIELGRLVKAFGGPPRAHVLLSSDGQDAELSALYNLVQPATGSISNLAFQRATDRSSPASQLTLPWLTLDPAYRTELVLANASDRVVNAQLAVHGERPGAASLRRSSLTVPARSQRVVPAEELVQLGAGSGSAGLSLALDAASGLLRASYVMTHRQTQATNATELPNPSSAGGNSTTLVVPWFSVVDGYDSRFVLVNRSAVPVSFHIDVRGEAGNQLGLGLSTGSIPAQGQLELPARSVLLSTSGGLTRASALITVAAPPSFIEGSYLIRSLATGALSATPMAKPSTLGGGVARLVLPWFSRVDGYLSRFVLVNRGPNPAPFSIEVLPEAGNGVAGQTVAGGVVPGRGMLVVPASDFVSAFDQLPRAAAVLRVQAPDDQVEALYNIVNPATGSISNTLLVHTPPDSAAPPQVPMQAQRAPYTDAAGGRAAGFVDAIDPEGRPLVFSLVGAPLRGTLTLDPVSGRFVYTPHPGQGQPADRFTVAVFNGVASRQLAIDITPGLGDPLYAHQWHLRNVGLPAFASELPPAGFDLNVEGAWALGYSGRGVKIGIVDDGLDMRHPDLAERTDLAQSRHFGSGGNDPSPTRFDDNHGTMVAGIAAASGFNGLGGRGVAWSARLRGYNYLNHQTLANFADAVGDAPYSADNHLFNLSLGMSGNSLPGYTGAYQAATSAALGLRGGRGAPLVSAAGNDFLRSDDSDCAQANELGVGCLDPAAWERNGGYYSLLVGALGADGRRASYSSSASALWISAPGGEYGWDRAWRGGGSAQAYQPAIVSTSMRGCGKPGTPYNALDSATANAWAPQCEYTARMNGSSAAAPAVAGVVALMLEANPRLTARDVRHILAGTARRVHPEHRGRQVQGWVNEGALDLELGWQRNAAGYWFNTWYGFGAVDAARAVAAARGASLLPPLAETRDYVYRAPANAVVPRRSARGWEVGVQVAEATASTVESVVLFFSLSQTPSLACNQIELVSPSGTRAIVLHAAKGFTNARVDNSRMVAHAFYGEPLNGRWLLRFLDVCSGGPATLLDPGIDQQLLFVAR